MKTTLNAIRDRLCACGCGNAAPLAKRTQASKGQVRGVALTFISGHNSTARQTLEYFMKRVLAVDSGCWEWTGPLNKKGYGRAQLNGTHHNAHRVIYTLSGLSIPDGLHLDHLCRNKKCVNPKHMEPITLLENVRRQHEHRRAAIEAKESEAT